MIINRCDELWRWDPSSERALAYSDPCMCCFSITNKLHFLFIHFWGFLPNVFELYCSLNLSLFTFFGLLANICMIINYFFVLGKLTFFLNFRNIWDSWKLPSRHFKTGKSSKDQTTTTLSRLLNLKGGKKNSTSSSLVYRKRYLIKFFVCVFIKINNTKKYIFIILLIKLHSKWSK